MAKLMKMITTSIWRNERDTEPLVNPMPNSSKYVATEEKMIRRLRTTATTYAINVFMMNGSPTDKIVFGRKYVTEMPPQRLIPLAERASATLH